VIASEFYKQQAAREAVGRAREVYVQAAIIMSATAVLAALVGVIFAYLVTRSVTGPLREAVNAVERGAWRFKCAH
jgi:ABC-type Fe3+ transport system permease subunit